MSQSYTQTICAEFDALKIAIGIKTSVLLARPRLCENMEGFVSGYIKELEAESISSDTNLRWAKLLKSLTDSILAVHEDVERLVERWGVMHWYHVGHAIKNTANVLKDAANSRMSDEQLSNVATVIIASTIFVRNEELLNVVRDQQKIFVNAVAEHGSFYPDAVEAIETLLEMTTGNATPKLRVMPPTPQYLAFEI